MQIQSESNFDNKDLPLTLQEIAEITLQRLIESGQGYSQAALSLKESIVRMKFDLKY